MTGQHSQATASYQQACLERLGLARNPFPVIPDVESFYESPRIDSLVTEVLHAILTRKGFLIITGEIGLGKTTIGRRLLKTLEENKVATSLVFNTFYQGVELLRAINRDFGIDEPDRGLEAQMAALNAFVVERNGAGVNCTIIIDDAQNLSAESLELLRMVSNLETDSEKLVQILLIGQPELAAKLGSHELRQLKSRIVINARVDPYDLGELKQYIYFKLNSAGCSGCLEIPERAFRLLLKMTRGNPRRVNLLMDRCLYAACAAGAARIGPALLREAQRDLDFAPAAPRRLGALSATLAGAALAGVVVAAAPLVLTPPAPVVADRNQGRILAAPAIATPEPAGAAPAATPTGPPAAQDTAVALFLAHYGLERYTDDLSQALRHKALEPVATRIAADTGLRLVGLREIPAGVGDRYGLLRVDLDGPRYLLLWRPDNWVHTYHYRYQGLEISALQRTLKGLQLYDYKVDGIVGLRLMQGLAEFQSSHGLPATGEPDAATQFLLAQAGDG